MSDQSDPEGPAPQNPSPAKSHGRKSIRATLRPRELITDSPDLAGAWVAQVITLLPQAFPGILGESLTGKALAEGRWSLRTIDLRSFGEGKHRNVDDTPAGGGAGMVLRPDVLGHALDEAALAARGRWPVIYLSPRGAPLTQEMARPQRGRGRCDCPAFGKRPSLRAGLFYPCQPILGQP